MRSKKDDRTETEREIDDFLSQFDSPADESSADYSTYLEPKESAADDGQSFSWKEVTPAALDPDLGAIDTAADSVSVSSGPDAGHDDTGALFNPEDFALEPDKKGSGQEAPEDVPANHKVGKKNRRSKDVRITSSIKKEDIEAAAETAADEAASFSFSDTASESFSEYLDGEVKEEIKDKPEKEPKDDERSGSGKSDKKKSSGSRRDRKIVTDKENRDDIDMAVSAAIAEKLAEDTAAAAAEEEKKDISAILLEKIEESKKADKKKKKIKKDKKKDKAPEEKPAAKSVKEETNPDKGSASKPESGSGKKDIDLSGDSEVKKYKRSVNKPGKKAVNSKFGKKAGKLAGKVKAAKGDRTVAEFLFLKKNPDYDPSKGETYEKDGKTIKNRKNKVSILKILLDIAAVFCVFVLAGVIFALGCIITAPKYDYKDIYSAVDTSSIVYDDQGQPIDNVFYTENRKVVKYKDMPEDLINAFVAIEDKTFWKHHGFNWTRMIGAILSSLTGNGRISGTSTITQQLARNVYLADTKSVRSIKRKLLEMYYASRIEHSLSKEEIVEAYLNTIYLGHGCYGVNAAAKTYFSKDVKDLDLVECAALAALPQSPDTYALLKLGSEAQDAKDPKVVATDPDTIVTNDISRDRRQLTLDLMLKQGMITQAEYDKAYDLKLNDFINPSISNSGSIYSYFHEYLVDTIIEDLVDQRGMTYEDAERMVYTKGLQIYSTIDSTAQKVIVDEFQDESNFPYITASTDADGNMLNNDGEISLYKYDNDFDEDGNFTLSGEAGDISVNSDGSVTINKDHKLHIYETDVDGETDYSLEFKSYYLYDDDDVLWSISGGYVNIPMGYKSLDSNGNVVISADFFSDPDYKDSVKISGKDLILKPGIYTLSSKSRQPQAAMTIVGVGTGEVKAMVGGRTTGGQKLLNRSLNARQPGSSIKPLAVYGAALQKSYDLNKQGKKWKFTDFGIDKQGTKGWGDYVTTYSSIEDEKTKIEGRYWPNNFNNSFSGKNTFMTAIQQSINTCAVKLELQIGDDYSVNQLKKFGLTTVNDDTSNPVNDVNPAALALGAMTQGVQPLEMALAYAAFPAGGKVNTPICYYKVLDRNGEVLLEGKSEQSEALNEGVAWIMTNVLQSVVKANSYMYVTDVQPGGKTGTTNDQYDIWFDGFTPTYAGSLWIGTDENVEMSSMSRPAAALWGKIMNQIPAAKTGEYLPQPENVIYTSGCYFTKGTETGLTSWSNEDERKKAMEKARKAAYEKWLKERENHKTLVIDVPAHDEDITQEEQYLIAPAHDEEQPVLDENGNPVLNEDGTPKTQIVHVPDQYGTRTVVIGTQHVDEVSHWEYEDGYKDGDFKFDASKYGF